MHPEDTMHQQHTMMHQEDTMHQYVNDNALVSDQLEWTHLRNAEVGKLFCYLSA